VSYDDFERRNLRQVINACDNQFPDLNLEDLQGNFSPEHQRKPREITTSGTTGEHLKVMTVEASDLLVTCGEAELSREGGGRGKKKEPVKAAGISHSWLPAKTK
jgi:hypothetical protein